MGAVVGHGMASFFSFVVPSASLERRKYIYPASDEHSESNERCDHYPVGPDPIDEEAGEHDSVDDDRSDERRRFRSGLGAEVTKVAVVDGHVECQVCERTERSDARQVERLQVLPPQLLRFSH